MSPYLVASIIWHDIGLKCILTFKTVNPIMKKKREQKGKDAVSGSLPFLLERQFLWVL